MGLKENFSPLTAQSKLIFFNMSGITHYDVRGMNGSEMENATGNRWLD